MNLGGLILEDAPKRDLQGVLGALVLSFALVPFQGWAALKGLLQKEEGPWFRTPKTGIITDPVRHLRRLHLLRRWLLGPRAGGYASFSMRGMTYTSPPSGAKRHLPTWWGGQAHARGRAPSRWIGWLVAGSLVLAFGALAWGSTRVPVVQAARNPLSLHGGAACTTRPWTRTSAPRPRLASSSPRPEE